MARQGRPSSWIRGCTDPTQHAYAADSMRRQDFGRHVAAPRRVGPTGRPGGGSQRQRARVEAPAARAGALAAAFAPAALPAAAWDYSASEYLHE